MWPDLHTLFIVVIWAQVIQHIEDVVETMNPCWVSVIVCMVSFFFFVYHSKNERRQLDVIYHLLQSVEVRLKEIEKSDLEKAEQQEKMDLEKAEQQQETELEKSNKFDNLVGQITDIKAIVQRLDRNSRRPPPPRQVTFAKSTQTPATTDQGTPNNNPKAGGASNTTTGKENVTKTG